MSVHKHVFMYRFGDPAKRNFHARAITNAPDDALEDARQNVHHQYIHAEPGDPSIEHMGQLLDKIDYEQTARQAMNINNWPSEN